MPDLKQPLDPVAQQRPAKASHAILFAGSALFIALSIRRLPPPSEVLQAPATPYDHAASRDAVPALRLLRRAAAVVPVLASVACRSEPSNSTKDTSLYRYTVAMLPGRTVWPAALWDVASPELEARAEYLVVLGPSPADPPGEALLETPDGTVWRRARK